MKRVLSLALWIVLVSGCRGGSSDVDADTDADVVSDGDADGDTDADVDSDGDADGDTDADVDSDGDADGDTDADVDSDGDADGDTDADVDSDGDADGDAAECEEGDERACEGGIDLGVCTPGIQVCVGGLWTDCEGRIEPAEEVCDGLDSDCDGVEDGDEEGMCPGDHLDDAVCVTDHCVIVACEAGFGDCDTDFDTGCETDLLSSIEHCGGCERPCDEGQICDEGLCTDRPILLWSHLFEASPFGSTTDLTVDGENRPTFAGRFTGTLDIGGETLESVDSTENDVFVVSFEEDGTQRWLRRLDSGQPTNVQGIGADEGGDVYLVANRLGDAGWSGRLWGLAAADGAQRWSTDIQAIPQAFALDDAGNVYITGYFLGEVDLGAGATTVDEGRGVFLASYSAEDGAYRWSRVMGSELGNISAVVVRPEAVWVAGEFVGALDLGGGERFSGGDRDLFLASYSRAGGAYVTDRHFDGTDEQTVLGLEQVGSGALVLLASLRGSVSLGGEVLTDTVDGFNPRVILGSFEAVDGVTHRWSLDPDLGYGQGFDTDGDAIYLGINAWFRVLDAATGDERWTVHRTTTDGTDLTMGAMEVVGDLLFVTEAERHFASYRLE